MLTNPVKNNISHTHEKMWSDEFDNWQENLPLKKREREKKKSVDMFVCMCIIYILFSLIILVKPL